MSVYDAIQQKLTAVLTKELLPKLAEVATEIVLNLGDEPPSKDSINILFEDAFRKVLDSPKSSKTAKAALPKPKSPKKKSNKDTAPKPPKSKWIDLGQMKEQLNQNDGKKYFCGFVADRGPNKRMFCGVELGLSNNCGVMSNDKEWTPHTPEEEKSQVENLRDMRCKHCWAVGKNGAYRKQGGFMKFYSDELIEPEAAEEPEPEAAEDPPDSPSYDPYPEDSPTFDRDDGTF